MRRFAIVSSVHRVHRLTVTTVCWLLLITPTVVLAGSDFQDISPNYSTFYGPANGFGASGGRVNKLASVPGSDQIFYAASEWGGLFKTTNGGLTWFRLDGHVPVAVWDVEVDPINPNIVYATSFYDGRTDPLSGIEVSYDSGTTWWRPSTAIAPPDFSCSAKRREQASAFGIAIQPDAPQNVFVGTSCGLAVSNDSGVTWDFIDPTPNVSNCPDGSDACDVWDVVAQPGGINGHAIVDICGEDGHWRTTDGGVTWTGGSLDLPKGRCSIAVSPDEPYVLFVADDLRPNDPVHHYVWESDDGGMSWINLGKPYPADQHKRIPFLVTNQRSDSGGVDRFDLWYGEQDLFRVACQTPHPSVPAASTTPQTSRCLFPPSPVVWQLPGPGPQIEHAGAHGDAGDLVFDRTSAADACPRIFSSDGGVYWNVKSGSDCHDPQFAQPLVSPHGLWLWGMAGVNDRGDNVDLYFGVQDDGAWVTSNAQDTPPNWNDGPTSDSFTIVADSVRVVRLDQDGLKVHAPGTINGPTVNTPLGHPLVMFRFINAVDRFGDKKYVVVKAAFDADDNDQLVGEEQGGVYLTMDITASPVNWVRLGDVGQPHVNVCGIRASVAGASPDTPVFFAKAGKGNCNANIFDNIGDQLWKYEGTDPNGSWQRIDNNDGMSGGIGIFGVDPVNPDRLYASNLRLLSGPRMVFSNDGGLNWDPDPELDEMMTGGGVFRYLNHRGATTDTAFFWTFPGYPQPSLVAFDPLDSNIVVAGGRDSGLFLSTNGGQDWGLLTDPMDPGTSGVPHLPRPWFAHFHHDSVGDLWLYVGTQGRGVWRIGIRQPTASAGGPYSTVEGTDVTLDAGGSSDPDAQTLTYDWDLDNDGEFDDASGAQPVFSEVGQDGVYSVRVKVSAGGVFAIAETTVTVVNLAPSVVLQSDAPTDEADVVTITGIATDPGWLNPLTATVDWGDGSPPEPVAGVLEQIRPDASLSFGVSHVYGDNGTFTATVCAYDDDTTTCQPISMPIDNVDPSAEIDESQSILINGIPTIIVSAGETVDFSGRCRDPGSDDLALSWDWDDGPPSPDVTTAYLVNPPSPDPFPSPSIEPRDITDIQPHVFSSACLYVVDFLAEDDDGGNGADSANVIAVGNADLMRSPGYWKHQFRGSGKIDFSQETLECYLAIVEYMSAVFNEVRDASSTGMAAGVLATASGAHMADALDRQLLAVWLNFANGAIDYAELVDTDGDDVGDTSFGDVVANAEAIRLNPNSTKSQLEMHKDILEMINLRDEHQH